MFLRYFKRITEDAMKLLVSYPWKGNIRELRNVIERGVLLMEGNELKANDLSIQSIKTSDLMATDEFQLKIPSDGIKIDIVLKLLIEQTLKITGGNQVHAAKVLGLSRSKLRYRMEQLGIQITKTF